jgi:hypothetical protein
MWKRISRRSTLRFNHHLVDVVAVEAFERAYVVSQPGRVNADEHHRGLALDANMALDFARCGAKFWFRQGQMTILDQAGVLAAANVNDWNPRGDARGYRDAIGQNSSHSADRSAHPLSAFADRADQRHRRAETSGIIVDHPTATTIAISMQNRLLAAIVPFEHHASPIKKADWTLCGLSVIVRNECSSRRRDDQWTISAGGDCRGGECFGRQESPRPSLLG